MNVGKQTWQLYFDSKTGLSSLKRVSVNVLLPDCTHMPHMDMYSARLYASMADGEL